LVDRGETFGDQRARSADFCGFVFAGTGGAAPLGDGGESLHGEWEEFVDHHETEDAAAAPENAVVEENAALNVGRPGELESIFFEDGPVAGDAVEQAQANRIEDGGPEVFERTGGLKDDVDDEVGDKEDDALEIHDEQFAGKGCDREEERAEEEDLDDRSGEERMDIPAEVTMNDAGVVGPGGKGPGGLSEDQAGEAEMVVRKEPAQRPPR
jgi:hypothetical protein